MRVLTIEETGPPPIAAENRPRGTATSGPVGTRPPPAVFATRAAREAAPWFGKPAVPPARLRGPGPGRLSLAALDRLVAGVTGPGADLPDGGAEVTLGPVAELIRQWRPEGLLPATGDDPAAGSVAAGPLRGEFSAWPEVTSWQALAERVPPGGVAVVVTGEPRHAAALIDTTAGARMFDPRARDGLKVTPVPADADAPGSGMPVLVDARALVIDRDGAFVDAPEEVGDAAAADRQTTPHAPAAGGAGGGTAAGQDATAPQVPATEDVTALGEGAVEIGRATVGPLSTPYSSAWYRAFEVQRYSRADGETVSLMVVRIAWRNPEAVTAERLEAFQQRVRDDVHAVYNTGARLENGDLLRVEVEFVRDAALAHQHVHISTAENRSHIRDWWIGERTRGVWAHEVGHYLGLPDEYREVPALRPVYTDGSVMGALAVDVWGRPDYDMAVPSREIGPDQPVHLAKRSLRALSAATGSALRRQAAGTGSTPGTARRASRPASEPGDSLPERASFSLDVRHAALYGDRVGAGGHLPPAPTSNRPAVERLGPPNANGTFRAVDAGDSDRRARTMFPPYWTEDDAVYAAEQAYLHARRHGRVQRAPADPETASSPRPVYTWIGEYDGVRIEGRLAHGEFTSFRPTADQAGLEVPRSMPRRRQVALPDPAFPNLALDIVWTGDARSRTGVYQVPSDSAAHSPFIQPGEQHDNGTYQAYVLFPDPAIRSTGDRFLWNLRSRRLPHVDGDRHTMFPRQWGVDRTRFAVTLAHRSARNHGAVSLPRPDGSYRWVGEHEGVRIEGIVRDDHHVAFRPTPEQPYHRWPDEDVWPVAVTAPEAYSLVHGAEDRPVDVRYVLFPAGQLGVEFTVRLAFTGAPGVEDNVVERHLLAVREAARSLYGGIPRRDGAPLVRLTVEVTGDAGSAHSIVTVTGEPDDERIHRELPDLVGALPDDLSRLSATLSPSAPQLRTLHWHSDADPIELASALIKADPAVHLRTSNLEENRRHGHPDAWPSLQERALALVRGGVTDAFAPGLVDALRSGRREGVPDGWHWAEAMYVAYLAAFSNRAYIHPGGFQHGPGGSVISRAQVRGYALKVTLRNGAIIDFRFTPAAPDAAPAALPHAPVAGHPDGPDLEADPPLDVAPAPQAPSIPIEDVLEGVTVGLAADGQPIGLWLPGAPADAPARDTETLARLEPPPDSVFVFGTARDGRVVLGDRVVSEAALAAAIASRAPGRAVVLWMSGMGEVAVRLARLLDAPVVATPHEIWFDEATGRLVPDRSAAADATGLPVDRWFRLYEPGHTEGVPVHPALPVVRAEEPPPPVAREHEPPSPVAHSPVRHERVSVDPAALAVGVPRTGLPNVPALLRELRSVVGRGVTEDELISLQRGLVSNYPYLPGGMIVQLGSAELLISLAPDDPVVVIGPAASPGATPASGAAESRATGLISSVFSTGAHVQTHTGTTSMTRGAVSMTFGVGVTPFVLQNVRVGVGLSGVANRSDRETTRTADAESGHVQDHRGETVLVSFAPNWSFKVRTRRGPRAGWEEIPPHPVPDTGGDRLLLWLPENYLRSAPEQVTAIAPPVGGLRPPTGRIPTTYLAAGLTGLPALFDRIVARLREQGVRLPIGSIIRAELTQKLWNLNANLDRAVNDNAGRGYRFHLHSWDERGTRGRTVASVEVHAERVPGGARRVGATSDKTHIEDVRTAIEGTGGSHTVGNSRTLTGSLEFAMAPGEGIADPGIGVTGYLSGTWSTTDGVSASRTGLNVMVPRYTGQTAGYEAEFVFTAVTRVRGGLSRPEARTTEPVRSRALLLAPEPDAFEHGFPVDREALKVHPGERATVPYAPEAVRGTGRREGDPVQKTPPEHLVLGHGVGTGLVTVPQSTIDLILAWLIPLLSAQGFLPADAQDEFARPWWTHGNDLDSRLDNLLLLLKLLSPQGLDAHYDEIHQGGLVLTLRRRRGALGVDLDVDSAKITIRAVPSPGRPPVFQRTEIAQSTVNLAMGMDTAGHSTGGSRRIAAGVRFKTFFEWFRNGLTGLEAHRTVGAGDAVRFLSNRPELLEYTGATDEWLLTSDYIITVEYQHSGLQGRVRPGVRDPAPFRLDGQTARVRTLPLGAGTEPGPTSAGPTPPRVLKHALPYFADFTGMRDAAAAVLRELLGPAGAADQELDTFAGTIQPRAHLKEIFQGAYTTDQFFRSGFFRDTFAALDITGTMGDVAFLDATTAPFVHGDIQLGLSISKTTDLDSHGVTLSELDAGFGGTAADAALTGEADLARRWVWSRSHDVSRTGGLERIQLDFNRTYLYRTTFDAIVTSWIGREGKVARNRYRSARRQITDRLLLFVAPEPEALNHYGENELPVSDAQLADALGRWAKGHEPESPEAPALRLSGDTVARVLMRWVRETPTLPASLTGPGTDREALARRLGELHADGALPIADDAVRARFNEAFGLALADRTAPPRGPDMPVYLTRPDHRNRMLGHHGVHDLTYDSGRSTLEIVRDQVERVAPGLLAADPEVWDAEGRAVGRLQGGIDSLQAVLAQGRDTNLLQDALSPNGVKLVLVHPNGWFWTDIVEVTLSAALTTDPEVTAYRPNTGLENYGHAYESTSATRAREGGQTFTLARLSAGYASESDGGPAHAPPTGPGTGALRVAEGHRAFAVRAEQATAEQTVYDWSGDYLVRFGQALTVTVRRRPWNLRPIRPARHAIEEVTEPGTLVLRVPRAIAEAGNTHGPAPLHSSVPLPDLPGNAYVLGALLDDALPEGDRLMNRVFGRGDGTSSRSVLSLPALLSRTYLSNHLVKAIGGRRHKLGEHLFVPGRSSDRATLWLSGDLFDLEVVGEVQRGTGTGRYGKHQIGSTAGADSDHWRPTADVSGSLSGTLPPSSTSMGASSGPSRTTSAGQTSAGTENYRREQHAKEQGPVVMVRMRGLFHLEADKYRHHLWRGRTFRGTWRSDPITGDVYAMLPVPEVERLRAAVSESPARARDTAPVWPETDEAPAFDLGGLLEEAARGGSDAAGAHQSVARRLRELVERPRLEGRSVVLTHDAAADAERLFRAVVPWAVRTMTADLAAARAFDPTVATPRSLTVYRRHLDMLPRIPGTLTGTVAEETAAIIREVHRVHALNPGNAEGAPAALPPEAAVLGLDPVFLARGVARELAGYVRLDVLAPDGTVTTRRWAGPDGRVHAFHPRTGRAHPVQPVSRGSGGRPTTRDRPGAVPHRFDGVALAAGVAQELGLLPARLRPEVELFGLDPLDLGTIYRTSWSRGRTFEQAVLDEIGRRRERLASLHPALPELPLRVHAAEGFLRNLARDLTERIERIEDEITETSETLYELDRWLRDTDVAAPETERSDATTRRRRLERRLAELHEADDGYRERLREAREQESRLAWQAGDLRAAARDGARAWDEQAVRFITDEVAVVEALMTMPTTAGGPVMRSAATQALPSASSSSSSSSSPVPALPHAELIERAYRAWPAHGTADALDELENLLYGAGAGALALVTVHEPYGRFVAYNRGSGVQWAEYPSGYPAVPPDTGMGASLALGPGGVVLNPPEELPREHPGPISFPALYATVADLVEHRPGAVRLPEDPSGQDDPQLYAAENGRYRIAGHEFLSGWRWAGALSDYLPLAWLARGAPAAAVTAADLVRDELDDAASFLAQHGPIATGAGVRAHLAVTMGRHAQLSFTLPRDLAVGAWVWFSGPEFTGAAVVLPGRRYRIYSTRVRDTGEWSDRRVRAMIRSSAYEFVIARPLATAVPRADRPSTPLALPPVDRTSAAPQAPSTSSSSASGSSGSPAGPMTPWYAGRGGLGGGGVISMAEVTRKSAPPGGLDVDVARWIDGVVSGLARPARTRVRERITELLRDDDPRGWESLLSRGVLIVEDGVRVGLTFSLRETRHSPQDQSPGEPGFSSYVGRYGETSYAAGESRQVTASAGGALDSLLFVAAAAAEGGVSHVSPSLKVSMERGFSSGHAIAMAVQSGNQVIAGDTHPFTARIHVAATVNRAPRGELVLPGRARLEFPEAYTSAAETPATADRPGEGGHPVVRVVEPSVLHGLDYAVTAALPGNVLDALATALERELGLPERAVDELRQQIADEYLNEQTLKARSQWLLTGSWVTGPVGVRIRRGRSLRGHLEISARPHTVRYVATTEHEVVIRNDFAERTKFRDGAGHESSASVSTGVAVGVEVGHHLATPSVDLPKISSTRGHGRTVTSSGQAKSAMMRTDRVVRYRTEFLVTARLRSNSGTAEVTGTLLGELALGSRHATEFERLALGGRPTGSGLVARGEFAPPPDPVERAPALPPRLRPRLLDRLAFVDRLRAWAHGSTPPAPFPRDGVRDVDDLVLLADRGPIEIAIPPAVHRYSVPPAPPNITWVLLGEEGSALVSRAEGPGNAPWRYLMDDEGRVVGALLMVEGTSGVREPRAFVPNPAAVPPPVLSERATGTEQDGRDAELDRTLRDTGMAAVADVVAGGGVPQVQLTDELRAVLDGAAGEESERLRRAVTALLSSPRVQVVASDGGPLPDTSPDASPDLRPERRFVIDADGALHGPLRPWHHRVHPREPRALAARAGLGGGVVREAAGLEEVYREVRDALDHQMRTVGVARRLSSSERQQLARVLAMKFGVPGLRASYAALLDGGVVHEVTVGAHTFTVSLDAELRALRREPVTEPGMTLDAGRTWKRTIAGTTGVKEYRRNRTTGAAARFEYQAAYTVAVTTRRPSAGVVAAQVRELSGERYWTAVTVPEVYLPDGPVPADGILGLGRATVRDGLLDDEGVRRLAARAGGPDAREYDLGREGLSGVQVGLLGIREVTMRLAELIAEHDRAPWAGASAQPFRQVLAELVSSGARYGVAERLQRLGTQTFLESNVRSMLREDGVAVRLPDAGGWHREVRVRLRAFNAEHERTVQGTRLEQYTEADFQFSRQDSVTDSLGATGGLSGVARFGTSAGADGGPAGSSSKSSSQVGAGAAAGGAVSRGRGTGRLGGGLDLNLGTYSGDAEMFRADAVYTIEYRRWRRRPRLPERPEGNVLRKERRGTPPRFSYTVTRHVRIDGGMEILAPAVRAADHGLPVPARSSGEAPVAGEAPAAHGGRGYLDDDLALAVAYVETIDADGVLRAIRRILGRGADPELMRAAEAAFNEEAIRAQYGTARRAGIHQIFKVPAKHWLDYAAWDHMGMDPQRTGTVHLGIRVTAREESVTYRRPRPDVRVTTGGQAFAQQDVSREHGRQGEVSGSVQGRWVSSALNVRVAGRAGFGYESGGRSKAGITSTTRDIRRAIAKDTSEEFTHRVVFRVEVFYGYSTDELARKAWDVLAAVPTLLEVLSGGASLRLWRRFFPPARPASVAAEVPGRAAVLVPAHLTAAPSSRNEPSSRSGTVVPAAPVTAPAHGTPTVTTGPAPAPSALAGFLGEHMQALTLAGAEALVRWAPAAALPWRRAGRLTASGPGPDAKAFAPGTQDGFTLDVALNERDLRANIAALLTGTYRVPLLDGTYLTVRLVPSRGRWLTRGEYTALNFPLRTDEPEREHERHTSRDVGAELDLGGPAGAPLAEGADRPVVTPGPDFGRSGKTIRTAKNSIGDNVEENRERDGAFDYYVFDAEYRIGGPNRHGVVHTVPDGLIGMLPASAVAWALTHAPDLPLERPRPDGPEPRPWFAGRRPAVTWHVSTYSAYNPDGTPVPSEERACVSVTVMAVP